MKKSSYISIFLIASLSITMVSVMGYRSIVINTSSPNNSLIVDTEYGKVQGKEWDDNTYSWLGIPFAAPPIGELRWKAPVDPEPWDGVLETKEFSQAPLQYANWMACIDEDLIRNYALFGSEDCLYLNVWVPKSADLNDREGLPVYVYVYGGGNIVGQTNFPVYYGAHLADRANCVVVTMNYRVGIAGWHYNPALHDGNPLDDSGNYALLDIFKSFEWVKANIKNFGGNPDDITIAGESAGAMNLYATLTSPYLKQEFFDKGVELFHRAVIESGGMLPSSTDSALEASQTLLAAILITNGIAADLDDAMAIINSSSNAQIKAWFMGESMEDIYSFFAGESVIDLLGSIMSAPSIISDGYVCASNPYISMLLGDYIQVPTIIGCNQEEAKVFLAWVIDEQTFTDVMFGYPHSDNLVDYLEPLRFYSEDLAPYLDWIIVALYEAVAEIANELIQLIGVDLPATLMNLHQDNVFTYQFAWNQEPEPFDILIGACHGSEIPFIFGNVGDGESDPFGNALWCDANKPGRTALSDVMISYWSNFMRVGDPGDPDGGWWFWERLPNWEPYRGLLNPFSNERMFFDATNTEVDIYMDE